MSALVPVLSRRRTPTFEQLTAFTEEWLENRSLAANSRDAYRRDVSGYQVWCVLNGIEPLKAKFTHLNKYRKALEATEDSRTRRPLAPSTVARKLSVVSSWYGFLVKLGVLTVNPAALADRPKVSRDTSPTIGMAVEEVDRLLAVAVADSARAGALMTVLAELGLRVSELIGLRLENLAFEAGRHTVRFTVKGGGEVRRTLPRASVVALERYLGFRSAEAGVPVSELTGLVFVTRGGKPLERQAVALLLKRLARKAYIASWEKLSPHSLRHAFVTACRKLGIPLEDIQAAMGHRDSRTTMRYDRDQRNLENDPALALGLARDERMAKLWVAPSAQARAWTRF